MKRTSRYGLVVLLSAIMAWLGHVFGSRGAGAGGEAGGPGTHPSRGKPEQRGVSDASDQMTSEKSRIRGLLGRTEKEVLWERLLAVKDWDAPKLSESALLDELIDREGEGLWKRLLEIPDAEQRTILCERTLELYAVKDPWLAYEMFLRDRDSFPDEWGNDAGSWILKAATRISADKFIEVMEQSRFEETVNGFQGEFSPGFDFGKLALHLESSKLQAAAVPLNLVESWVAVSPLEAVEYLNGVKKMVHPEKPDVIFDSDRKDGVDVPGLLQIVALSKDKSRNKALMELGRSLGGDIEGTWKRRAERDEGKLVPEMLDAATVMGQRDNYLVNALITTRGRGVADDSWKQVPPDERARLLGLAEKQWEREANAPVDVRARERWRAMMEEAWVEP